MFHKANICLLLLAAAALLLLAGVSATELRSLDEMERSLYNPSSTCATDADCTNYILFKRCRDWGTNLFGITVGFKCSVF